MIEAMLLYILNVAVTMLALAVGYKLLLSSETFFGFNRFVLLLSLGLPFVLPCCGLTFHVTVPLSAAPVAATAAAVSRALPWWQVVLLAAYAVGLLAMLVRTAVAMVATQRLIRTGSRENGRLVVVESDMAPFNWFNTVVIGRKDYESRDAAMIVAHECAHRERRHSWDLLYCEVVMAAQWFNPAAWLLRNDLRKVHEFEADRATVAACGNRSEYQETLISRACAMSAGLMANGFTQQTLKNRIIMLNKKQSSRKRALRALYLLAVIGLSMVANAKTVVTPAVPDNDAAAHQNEVAAQRQAPQSQVVKKVRSFAIAPSGKVESHHEGSPDEYRYYLDGKPIADPSAVSPGEVKSMKVMRDGDKTGIYLYTTEHPGAKTVANIQTSTTFTDDEGNKTTVGSDGVKYGYAFYVDGERRESISDIPNDRIESIIVDKSQKDHPKVMVTLKK